MDVPIDFRPSPEFLIACTYIRGDEAAREVYRMVEDRAKQQDVQMLCKVRQFDSVAIRPHKVLKGRGTFWE